MDASGRDSVFFFFPDFSVFAHFSISEFFCQEFEETDTTIAFVSRKRLKSTIRTGETESGRRRYVQSKSVDFVIFLAKQLLRGSFLTAVLGRFFWSLSAQIIVHTCMVGNLMLRCQLFKQLYCKVLLIKSR